MNIILNISGRKTIKNPNSNDIEQAVRSLDPKDEDSFLILSKDELDFMQIWLTENNSFGVEYQEVDKPPVYKHFRCKQFFKTDEITKVLISYFNGSNMWKENKDWQLVGKVTKNASKGMAQKISNLVFWVILLLFLIFDILLKFHPSSVVNYEKLVIYIAALFPIWAIIEGFRTGNLPSRFLNVNRYEHPVSFYFGILIYLSVSIIVIYLAVSDELKNKSNNFGTSPNVTSYPRILKYDGYGP